LHTLVLCSSSLYFERLTESHFFIETSSIDLSDSPFIEVLEPLFKYLYQYPIEVPDSKLGLFWRALHYFQVDDQEVLNLLIDKIPVVPLSDFHSISREVFDHQGCIAILDLILGVTAIHLEKHFEFFFEEFDYGNEILWNIIWTFLSISNLSIDEKNFIDNHVLHLVFDSLDLQNPLVNQFVTYVGKISDQHLLNLFAGSNQLELDEQTRNFWKVYVNDHIVEIDSTILDEIENTLFNTSSSNISIIEFEKKD